MLAKRWTDIGNPMCTRCRLFFRTALPEKKLTQEYFTILPWKTKKNWHTKIFCDLILKDLLRGYVLTCLPLNSIWKFLALSWVTLPPKSSWYTWLDSFHMGALLCITSCASRLIASGLEIPTPLCLSCRYNVYISISFSGALFLVQYTVLIETYFSSEVEDICNTNLLT